MRSLSADNVRNLSQPTVALVPATEGWYNAGTMRLRLAVLAALFLVCLTPRLAGADVTIFLGTTITSSLTQAGVKQSIHRPVRGFAGSISLVIVGFEFEYASRQEDDTLLAPSLKTTSGNVFVQTFGLPGFQLYATTGAGLYRERLGPDQETSFLLNNGGGVKVTLAGPFRVRVDYRIFNLRGHPQYATVQRIYAGLNLAF